MQFEPLRHLPTKVAWKPGDSIVIFGELFSRGYVNGLIDEAKARGLNVIYATVGRRNEEGRLRKLTETELADKDQPLINIPLEAGFDLEPSRKGTSPAEQLEGLKLSEWQSAKLDWAQVEESRLSGIESFLVRTREYLAEVERRIPKGANVLFVHTMAGGVPRAKIMMPAMNRVFKGFGDRFASSEEFWKSELGRLADKSFMEVTAQTFHHLIELSTNFRERLKKEGRQVSYVAYGYHGTEVLVGDKYHWQSYSPYLQGFAKLELENIAARFQAQGVNACVFNAPEILTNSSSIFVGVEVPLYPLLGALEREGRGRPAVETIVKSCRARLKSEFGVQEIMARTAEYFNHPVTRKWTNFPAWPQHNGKEQMELMRTASQDLVNMHLDPRQLITETLSEVVFKACGKLMLAEGFEPKKPVCWLGHDIVAKQTAAH